MKALVYTGPKQLELCDVNPPVLKEGEALVEVEACGICGSDMHAWHGHDERRPAPLILGHEAAGVIVDGPGVGTRVTVNPLVTCGQCEPCRMGRENLCLHRQIISMPPREGAFANLLAIPQRNLVKVPDHVSFEKAALTEPIACGWHAVQLAQKLLIKPLKETTVLVMGGGAIGLGAALSLSTHGAHNIWLAETNVQRHAAVAQAGTFKVFNPHTSLGPDVGQVDLVIDGVGTWKTRAAACHAICPGGIMVHIGLSDAEGGLDVRRMTLQELTFLGTYTYTAADFCDTAAAIFDGRLGGLDWMEVRPLANGADAFRDINNSAAAAPKIILKP